MTSAPKPLPPVVDPLADLRAALPADLAPWVDRFGPGFIAMTRDELRSWITLANTGQSYEAYREIAQALPDTQLPVKNASLRIQHYPNRDKNK